MVIETENKMSKFFSGVYLWMFIGLMISGGVAYYTSVSEVMMAFVFKNILFIIIAELALVFILNFLRSKISPTVAKVLFALYSAVSGLTLSSVFLVYKIDSIVFVFLSSAVMFGLLALYGYTTKQDLSSFGKMLIFGLLAVIVMSIINMFTQSSSFGIVISIISIVIFLGLTAWDMQMLKHIYNHYQCNEEELQKMTIYGALNLYLDFVNIFLELLRLFGKKRD